MPAQLKLVPAYQKKKKKKKKKIVTLTVERSFVLADSVTVTKSDSQYICWQKLGGSPNLLAETGGGGICQQKYLGISASF